MHLRRSIVVVVALLLSLVLAPPIASAAYTPPGGAMFNNPQGNRDARFRIIQTVNKAIKHSPRGSRIQMSMYMMDSRASTDLLIGARNRGVKVQLVLDGTARNPHTKRLARKFNRDNHKLIKPKKAHGKKAKKRTKKKHADKGHKKAGKKGKKGKKKHAGKRRRGGPDGSFVVFCKKSCRAVGKPNHTKYFTFTRTGKARNVVMVSSSNLNKGGAVKGFNDLYVLKGRKKLIRDFGRVHKQMSADTSGDGDHFLKFRRGRILARFFPKRKGPDPVMLDLRKVHCKSAKGGRTAINVSMFRWNSERGFKIARKLVRLDNQGCKVSVIFGAPGRKVWGILMRSARHGGIRLWDSRVDFDYDLKPDLRTHHKYLLIKGWYGRDRRSWQVHTGSANWGRSLRAGDENTLSISGRRAYKQYIRNWRWLTKHAARRIGR